MNIEPSKNPSAGAARRTDADGFFLFDHLPKTGGTALKLAFEQIFGADRVSPPVLGRTERWAEKNFAAYRMIVGHFHNPAPLTGRSESRIRLTVLRDPIDRAVSEYFYYRNNVDKLPWHNLALYSKDHDLYAYLKLLEAQGNVSVSNRYAHHFAAQLARGPWRDSRLLSLAKEALAGYDFVGIQEQLVDSVDLFCGEYGLPAPAEIPRANVTSKRKAFDELDSRTREGLIRLNRVDTELYEFARSRFRDAKRAIFRRFAARDSACGAEDAGEPPLPDARSPLSAAGNGSFGDRSVEFADAAIVGSSSADGAVRAGEQFVVRLTIESHLAVPDLTIGVQIVDDVGEVVFGTNTFLLGESRPVAANRSYDVSFVFDADMRPGRYTLGASLHTGASHVDRCFHWCEQLAAFDVVAGAQQPYVGYCKLDTRIEWTESAP